jgi:hypothetical protein
VVAQAAPRSAAAATRAGTRMPPTVLLSPRRRKGEVTLC